MSEKEENKNHPCKVFVKFSTLLIFIESKKSSRYHIREKFYLASRRLIFRDRVRCRPKIPLGRP